MISPAGAVLAGGRGLRMGRDKATLDLLGRPLVSWVVSAVRQACREVYLVGGDPALAAAHAVAYAPDLLPGAGPLGGLYSALCAAGGDVLLVGCDMPLLQPALLRGLISLAGEADIVVPVKAGEYEPLTAVYRASCRPAVEAALAAGKRRVVSAFEGVSVRTVAEDEWSAWDAEGLSFINLNTPEDYRRVVELMQGGRWSRPAAISSA